MVIILFLKAISSTITRNIRLFGDTLTMECSKIKYPEHSLLSRKHHFSFSSCLLYYFCLSSHLLKSSGCSAANPLNTFSRYCILTGSKQKESNLPYPFSHPKKLQEGNKNKTRDSKDMKNRLLPEILFIFVVPFIIFDKEIPFKDWLFSSYHQLQLLNYFILLRWLATPQSPVAH